MIRLFILTFRILLTRVMLFKTIWYITKFIIDRPR